MLYGPYLNAAKWGHRKVLILIFLENALRLNVIVLPLDGNDYVVLILIFLENALRPNDERLTL